MRHYLWAWRVAPSTRSDPKGGLSIFAPPQPWVVGRCGAGAHAMAACAPARTDAGATPGPTCLRQAAAAGGRKSEVEKCPIDEPARGFADTWRLHSTRSALRRRIPTRFPPPSGALAHQSMVLCVCTVRNNCCAERRPRRRPITRVSLVFLADFIFVECPRPVK